MEDYLKINTLMYIIYYMHVFLPKTAVLKCSRGLEVAQQLRAHVVLSEDAGSIPSSHMVLQNHL